MRDILAAIMLIVFIAASAMAQGSPGTIGLYFTNTPGQMHYSPVLGEEFKAYIYCHAVPCNLTAVEFSLKLPKGIVIESYEIPQGGLDVGLINEGMSIAYWPPFNPGYILLCTLNLFALSYCWPAGGTLMDAPATIVPHPDTGFLSCTCRTVTAGQSKYDQVWLTGLTSIICPCWISTEEKTWGAIKSLYAE